MTGMRDDLQARARDTLMQTLGVDRRNSDILVSDKYQRRNPNPVDLARYSHELRNEVVEELILI